MTKPQIKKIFKRLAVTLLIMLGLLATLMFYFNSKPGQNFLGNLIFNQLSQKFGTPIRGTLSYSIPDWVNLEDLYLEDTAADTLLYAKKAHINLALFKLLKNHLEIEKVELEDAIINVHKRQEKYNFDHIIQAFNTPTDTTTPPLIITLNSIKLHNIRANYTDEDSKSYFNVKLGDFSSGFKNLDFGKGIYHLKDTYLSSLILNGKVSSSENKPKVASTSSPVPDFQVSKVALKNINWDIDLAQAKTIGRNAELLVDFDHLDLSHQKVNLHQLTTKLDEVQYKQINFKPVRAGEINFNDINLADLKLSLESFEKSDSLLTGTLKNLTFKEKSGFEITHFNTSLQLKNQDLSLKNLNLKTANSLFSSNIEVQLDTADLANSHFKANISQLKLAVAEALYFDRSLAENSILKSFKNDILSAQGKVSGNVKKIQLNDAAISVPFSSNAKINGVLDFSKKFAMDLQINEFVTTPSDLKKVTGALPASIQFPEKINLNGWLKGTTDHLTTNLSVHSSQGNIQLDGKLSNLSRLPEYSGKVTLTDFAAGKWTKTPKLGKIAGTLDFVGSNFDKPTVSFKANIHQINYDTLSLQNINFEGLLADNKIIGAGSLHDKKVQLQLDGLLDFSEQDTKVQGKTNIAYAHLKQLGVVQEDITLKGIFDINQLIANFKKPYLDFSGANIVFTKDTLSFPVHKLSVLTAYREKDKNLELKTDFAELNVSGNFEYDQLGNILLTEINKYFKLPDFTPAVDSLDYYFDIKGVVRYNPVFTAFVPAVQRFSPINIAANLNSSQDISFSGNANLTYLRYDSIQVRNTNFDFKGDGKKLTYQLLSDQISNSSFRLRKADLHGSMQENVASFDLSVKDSLDKEIHTLAGFLDSDGKKVKISFDETGIMVFYQKWSGNPYGYIEYSPGQFLVNNVVFSSGNQLFRINSTTTEPNAPLTVEAHHLDLNFLSKAFVQDSTLASGFMNVDLQLVNFIGNESLAFTGEIDIEQFKFKQVSLGNLQAKAESSRPEEIHLYALLDGLDNQIELNGTYHTSAKKPLDFNLNVNNFNLTAIEPFLTDVLYDAKGYLNGNLTIKGSTDAPEINGKTTFSLAEFRIKETGALVKLNDQSIELKKSKILFDQFQLMDENNQNLQVNGAIDLADFSYNLNLSSNNFKIISANPGQSELFFGTGYLGAKVNIKGVKSVFKVTGDIATKEKTNLTLLLPDDHAGEDLNALVTFAEFNSSKKTQKVEEETGLSFANAVNVNILVDDKATLNILMDQVTGDQLTASGNGLLNVGFDNAGDLFIIGRLDLTKGSYELTFQTIKKKFEITPFSKSNIVFSGDPMKGILDVTAEYKVPGLKDVKTYPGLVQKNGKLFADLRVDLVLKGEIINISDINFEIVAKESQVESIKSDLSELGWSLIDDRNEKESSSVGAVTNANREMLKQNAIMLLVAGNFSAAQIFDSFTSNYGTGYEDLARRNASQIISSQLERYTSGLIKGLDLNVGVQSSGGAVEGGSDRSTNLNLGVSKRLANDRLVVTVGKNFELENKDLQSDEIFDNLEANWLITPDGKLRLKVFRKFQNQTAVEGSVIQTGFGIMFGIDYETWKELLKKKK